MSSHPGSGGLSFKNSVSTPTKALLLLEPPARAPQTFPTEKAFEPLNRNTEVAAYRMPQQYPGYREHEGCDQTGPRTPDVHLSDDHVRSFDSAGPFDADVSMAEPCSSQIPEISSPVRNSAERPIFPVSAISLSDQDDFKRPEPPPLPTSRSGRVHLIAANSERPMPPQSPPFVPSFEVKFVIFR